MSITLEERVVKLEAKIELLLQLFAQPDNASEVNKGSIPEPEYLLELTPKQHAVSQLIFFGHSTKNMAEVLGVSEPTVKVHIRAIMKKLSFRTRGQIAMLFERWREDCDPHVYLRQSGIPIDWAENIETYVKVTEMLRTKVR